MAVRRRRCSCHLWRYVIVMPLPKYLLRLSNIPRLHLSLCKEWSMQLSAGVTGSGHLMAKCLVVLAYFE